MAGRVTDKDRGWQRILGHFQAADLEVGVGVLGEAGAAVHDESELTVAEIGALHEFGYSFPTAAGNVVDVPARSFLRATLDANRAKYERQLEQAARGILDGKIDVQGALDLVGQVAVGDVQKRIADGIPPPNAPSTIARKGSSRTLVASGQLRRSITRDVRARGGNK